MFKVANGITNSILYSFHQDVSTMTEGVKLFFLTL